MSYFKAKMHQIQFRLGFRPRPRWGSLQSPSTTRGIYKMVWHRTSGSLPWRQVTGTLFQTFSLAFDGLKETALIFLQGPPPRCHRCQERGHKFIECDRPHCRCCRRVGHEESEACKRRPSDVGIDSWHGSRSGPRWHGPTAWRRKRYTWDNSSCDDGDATAGACRLVWACRREPPTATESTAVQQKDETVTPEPTMTETDLSRRHSRRRRQRKHSNADARYWYKTSVRLSVRPSVCYARVLHRNGLTRQHTFFSIVATSF